MEDYINTKKFPYKCNAITLMADNPELKTLCVDNNGKYIHIDYSGKVHEYEK